MSMSNLVEIELETSLGAQYRFPDVDAAVADGLVRGMSVADFPQLTLSNVSHACLVLPTRIIDVVRVDGEEKWRR